MPSPPKSCLDEDTEMRIPRDCSPKHVETTGATTEEMIEVETLTIFRLNEYGDYDGRPGGIKLKRVIKKVSAANALRYQS